MNIYIYTYIYIYIYIYIDDHLPAIWPRFDQNTRVSDLKNVSVESNEVDGHKSYINMS